MKNFFINHWAETITIVISLSSIFIAIFVARVTYSSYILSHRPYVWVENFGYLDQNNKIVNPINKVMIKVINSPAEITSQKYSYYVIDGKKKKNIEEDNPTNSIKYPSDKVQYTHSVSGVTENTASNLKENEKLIRYIRIEYKWLSSNRKYFFEGEWEYNKKNKVWDIISQKAN